MKVIDFIKLFQETALCDLAVEQIRKYLYNGEEKIYYNETSKAKAKNKLLSKKLLKKL